MEWVWRSFVADGAHDRILRIRAHHRFTSRRSFLIFCPASAGRTIPGLIERPRALIEKPA
jgi:hypothetical protein